MKGWFYREYGAPRDVLRYEEVPDPEPKDDQVLIRVHAASLNAADWHIMRADPFLVRLVAGIRRPKRPIAAGSDVAGVVEAVGEKVTRFSVGDRVMSETMMLGGAAELAAVPEKRIGHMPKDLLFTQAAAIPMAGVTALIAVMHDGRLQPGQDVLVLGASGGVGTFAVQIARALGGNVSAVCSAGAADLVASLGATEVIDYAQTDVRTLDRRFDLVVRIGGTLNVRELRRLVKPRGTLAAVGGTGHGGLLGPGSVNIRAQMLSPFVRQRLVSVAGKPNGPDLEILAGMIERGELRPVVDREFASEDMLEAMLSLEEGHPRGKIVVRVADELQVNEG